MDEQNKIDELVDILDKLMSDGGSHVKIITDNNYDEGTINIETTGISECCGGNACRIPNHNVTIVENK